ncbi:MAG: enoyl-CoA hydratase/isomerase family protein [Chloroflexi bacterium]|nr:enoyl-CoA hydratase/isomerase family protein [Chloroflexota bacterium]
MELKDVLYEKEDSGLAVLTLNRPESLNSMSGEMLDSWVQVIEDARKDPEVRVLMVTGAGRGFTSGANLRPAGGGERPQRGPTPPWEGIDSMKYGVHRIARGLRDFPKPYVAAVNGPAAGAGMDLATMADIRLMSDTARVGMTYIRMGWSPGNGGGYFLPRVMGMQRALELMWTGRLITAQEAKEYGWALEVYPNDQFQELSREFCRKIAASAPLAAQFIKRVVTRCQDLDLYRALELGELFYQMATRTEDGQEGPRAFAEKREPVFKGR